MTKLDVAILDAVAFGHAAVLTYPWSLFLAALKQGGNGNRRAR